MRIFINTIAVFSFIVQFIPFVFSVLNQNKPEHTIDILYNYFLFIAYLCSLLVVVVFVILYNFNTKAINNKWLNSIFLCVVILGTYIHISQLFVLKDFVLTSCILVGFDFYVLYKILGNLWKSGDSSINHGDTKIIEGF